jgi:LacI family transcriptional regulator
MSASRRLIAPSQSRPTINEVARRAQVSVATVSRVINSPSSVRPETRDRVLACMSALSYVPHGAVRDRGDARTGNIGVLLQASPGITRADAYILEILSGIESAADDAGLAVVVSVRHSVADLAENGPRSLAPGRIDGLIVTGTQVTGRQLDGIRRAGLPVVLLGPEEEVLGLWCVTSDARSGSELAVAHLLEVGRRRIVHIGGRSTAPVLSRSARGFGWRTSARRWSSSRASRMSATRSTRGTVAGASSSGC